MKNLFLTILTLLLLVPAAYAAGADAPLEAHPIRVAIIDTGISPAVISPDNILNGQNYIRPQDDTSDKIGHGTAVAAIIVGMENGKITGVCPAAQLVPLVYSTLDEENKLTAGNVSQAARAVQDAVDVYDCDIINISSGSAADSAVLRSAVEYAAGQGVLVIASAGNGGGTELCYPGAYDSVLCVGSCDENGLRADFSQDNDTVDLLARGTKLSIASLRGTRIRGEGTSYSAAVVTATAAQLWTQHPDLSADEVRQILLETALTVEGNKILDPEKTLTYTPGNPFVDVTEEDWFFAPVLWAAEKGITSGTSATTFSPHQMCKTSEILTFLWKYSGAAEASSGNPFTDVAQSDWYYMPALWAYEKGMVAGETLAGDTWCTRAEAMTLLWRLAGCPEGALAGRFADVTADTPYAQAVAWAVEKGITSGTSTETFSPEKICTRAEIMTFLWKYKELSRQ